MILISDAEKRIFGGAIDQSTSVRRWLRKNRRSGGGAELLKKGSRAL